MIYHSRCVRPELMEYHSISLMMRFEMNLFQVVIWHFELPGDGRILCLILKLAKIADHDNVSQVIISERDRSTVRT